ncbi:MAG: CPBP family intramembrane metalloprotease [Ruminococcus sp.]|nr:CPBP family intramembrane metalloprotease [Ruminococcus sp.]
MNETIPTPAGAFWRVFIRIVLVTGTFLLTSLAGSFLARRLGELTGIDNSYFRLLISSLPSIAAFLTIAAVNGRLKLIFSPRGFFTGLSVGASILVMALMSLLTDFYVAREEGFVRLPAEDIVFFTLAVFISAGFREELMFRGLILEAVRSEFDPRSKKGIYISVAVSAAAFGAIHFLNLTSADVTLKAVTFQALGAFAIGLLFGAVYVRSGCLLATVFLHGLEDFAGLMPSGVYGQRTLSESIEQVSVSGQFQPLIFFGAIALYLLRPSAIDKVVAPVAPPDDSNANCQGQE